MAKATEYHRFWPDDISVTNAEVCNYAELLWPKQIIDRYLLALAVRNNGQLVTFDHGIRLTAAIGATAEHLVQLPA